MHPSRRRSALPALVLVLLLAAAPAVANDVSGLRSAVSSDAIAASGDAAAVSGTGGAGLNFRTGPWGGVMRVLAEGTPLTIVGKDGDWYKVTVDGKSGYVHSDYVAKGSAAAQDSGAAGGVRYVDVNADSYLNVRTGPWGSIVGSLHRGDKVEVVGREGDWVKIKRDGGIAYVHQAYLSSSDPGGGGSTAGGSTAGVPGSTLGKRIVAEAESLLGSTEFRTADVDYGNLACAKVASTALHKAGVMGVVLNVTSIVDTLKSKGWKEVGPPYRDGDVVTWRTYDYTGDGRIDDDTHVGIVKVENGQAMAINNSSSLRMPRKTTINIAPISRVLRPPA